MKRKEAKYYLAYEEILCKMKMFKGIEKKNLIDLITLLDGKIKYYAKNEVILESANTSKYFGIVLDGSVESRSTTKEDEIIQRFNRANSFMEALAFGNYASFVDIVSSTDSRILFINSKKIIENQENKDVAKLMTNLLVEFSMKLSLMSFKNQLLSEPRVRTRLLMYLKSLAKDKDGFRKVPFLQKDLAQYLNVNKSAFNRELARMKKEGLIEVSGKKIKLLGD